MTVYLVGAGPGDPGLLTVRGARLLEAAEVVVHDRLVDPRLLDMVRVGAEVIDAGKRPGGSASQDWINELLVDRGRRLGTVVRLKGGDPFVFGRGGEEALALESAGVRYEVVPGVSAATAVPAYAGVPVTHRGLAASCTVIAGRGAPGEGSAETSLATVDWEALARLDGTVVLLMAVAARAEIARRMIAGGRRPATPVLAVEDGTSPRQKVKRTTLGALGSLELRAPATIVVGEVAGMGLRWFDERTLAGRTVVVTRARQQAPVLSSALAELGAEVVELPTIEIAPPADGGTALAEAAAGIDRYGWVIFTSANAVDPLMSRVRDARALAGARVGAIGPGTAEALGRHGIVPDVVPGSYVAEALLEAVAAAEAAGAARAAATAAAGGARNARVLLPRAAVARDVLPAGLRALGMDVDVVEAYRAVRPPTPEGLLEAVARADAVTFTASSTVTGFLEIAGAGRCPPVVACIGPITASTARQAGLGVSVVAGEHTIAGLVQALCEVLAPERAGDPPAPAAR